MANSLILCGGTGAHAALAMMRLHTLGYALGFFRQSNGKPLDFPSLYLVDQDAGDGATSRDRVADGPPAGPRSSWSLEPARDIRTGGRS